MDYFGEVGSLINVLSSNAKIPVKNNLIGPSVATGDWTPEMIWDTNYVQTYTSSLMALSVEQYAHLLNLNISSNKKLF
jgi:hypothetical protein